MKKNVYGYTVWRDDQVLSDYKITFKEALKQLHRASDEIKCLTWSEARRYCALHGGEIRFTLERYSNYDEDYDDYNTIETLGHYSFTLVYSKSKEKYIKKTITQ